ncbi:MAG: shikimate kinase [Desulfurellaceae bacterium]|nr:shikimate kinase [Desulfurellaceae bacterium]
MPDNIILTGFMGTGKTQVGRRLAKRLGWRFIDTDLIIEQELGTSIRQLFAEKGEAYFRGQERRVIARVCQDQRCVIATGGGAIVDPANAQQLQNSGLLICLTATPEVIFARVRGNTDRPLLQAEDPLSTIRSLLARRSDAYARAQLTIDTSQQSVEQVVAVVLNAYRDYARV